MNAQNNRVTLHGLVAKQTWNKKNQGNRKWLA